MSDIEDLLRVALKQQTEQLMTTPGLARRALRGAGRTRRVQYAATATVAALGTTAAVGVVDHNHLGRTSAAGPGACFGAAKPAVSSGPTSLEGAAPSPSLRLLWSSSGAPVFSAAATAVGSPGPVIDGSPASTSTAALSPTVSSTPASVAVGSESAQIKAVTLPDPAPGYPLRRAPDSVGLTGFGPGATYWSATFLLAVTTGATTSLGAGVSEVDPTGPEATVIVADGRPYDLSSPTSIQSVPVVKTLTVQGHPAYLTEACDQTDLYLSTGRFQVLVAGSGGTTVNKLVALENALTGLQ